MSLSSGAAMRVDGPASDGFERGATLGHTRAVHLCVAQADFAAALLNVTRPVPPGLVDPDGKPSARRFNVYRNNVLVGLTRVLSDTFRATARIVGDEFFAAMARLYIAREPPISPMLFDYGVGFPDFIESFDPVAGLPYLRDVARIERAWVEAYHAPEARSITPTAFALISPEDLPHLKVVLHPSLRILRSKFPVLTIWEMNINSGGAGNVDLGGGGEDVLITRSDATVELRVLPLGGAHFLEALLEGHSMLEATSAAMTADRRFDLSANLSTLMAAATFVDFRIQPIPPKVDGCAA